MKVVDSTAGISANPIRRRASLGCAAAVLAVAAMLSGSPDARAQDANSPSAAIQQLDAALLASMRAGETTPFTQRYAMLAPAVSQAFDLTAVLRAAVGPGWYRLSPNQQASLATTFQRYTISDYAANFDNYNGQSFRVLPQARTLPDGDVIVRTQIIRRNDSPVEIDYVMRHTPLGWKAVDVLTDGTISQVAVQRSDFGSLLASGGAPALEAGLQRKVSTLSNGAPA